MASVWAGAQNALAGGGSFVTFPALLLAGPGRASGERHLDGGAVPEPVALRDGADAGDGDGGGSACRCERWCAVSVLGGRRSGALLLIATPVGRSSRGWCPGWCCSRPRCSPGAASGPKPAGGGGAHGTAWRPSAVQAADRGVWRVFRRRDRVHDAGGADAGGGMAVRGASATKNVLAGVINAVGGAGVRAVAGRATGGRPAWCLRGLDPGGRSGGSWLLARVPERVLRGGVVVVGLALTAGLFLRQG